MLYLSAQQESSFRQAASAAAFSSEVCSGTAGAEGVVGLDPLSSCILPKQVATKKNTSKKPMTDPQPDFFFGGCTLTAGAAEAALGFGRPH